MEAARDYAGALIRRVPPRPLSPAFPCASSRPAFSASHSPVRLSCRTRLPSSPRSAHPPAPLIPPLPAFSCAPRPRAHTHPPRRCPGRPAAPAGRAQARPAPPHPLAAGRRCQGWLSRGARASADRVTADEWLHLWPLLQSRAQKRVRSQEPRAKPPRPLTFMDHRLSESLLSPLTHPARHSGSPTMTGAAAWVMASSLQELISKTLDALVITTGLVTLVLEEDGTVVDTEEFFQTLETTRIS
nr:uncharacterized protein LOC105478966 [Macaca nemestrina]